MTRSLLLDTCALLWIGSAPERLTDAAIKAIESAPFLYASPISAWEVALKRGMGKLTMAVTPEEWFATLKADYGITVIPLDEEVMFKAASLPLHHRDPADRFIISTALLRDLTVVTADRRYAEYGVNTIV